MSKTEKIQCPYKLGKFRCRHGAECQKDDNELSKPSKSNECSVALRQLEGRPFRDEKGHKKMKTSGNMVVFTSGYPYCSEHGAMNMVSPDGMWRCLMCNIGYNEVTKKTLKNSSEGFKEKGD